MGNWIIRAQQDHARKLRDAHLAAAEHPNCTVRHTALVVFFTHGYGHTWAGKFEMKTIPGLRVWTQMGEGRYGERTSELADDQMRSMIAVSRVNFSTPGTFETALKSMAHTNITQAHATQVRRGSYQFSANQTTFLNKLLVTDPRDSAQGIYVLNDVLGNYEVVIDRWTNLLEHAEFQGKIHREGGGKMFTTVDDVYQYLRDKGVMSVYTFDGTCSVGINPDEARQARSEVDFRALHAIALENDASPPPTRSSRVVVASENENENESANENESKGNQDGGSRRRTRRTRRRPRRRPRFLSTTQKKANGQRDYRIHPHAFRGRRRLSRPRLDHLRPSPLLLLRPRKARRL